MRKGGVRSFVRGAAQIAALGASSLALTASGAWAQDQYSQVEDPITVVGERPDLESPRYTAPLLETPQTITIVSAELVEQQNLLGLRDILSTLPGITFGAGEGGGGYGDSINLRGYSASNDISVDTSTVMQNCRSRLGTRPTVKMMGRNTTTSTSVMLMAVKPISCRPS